MYRLFVLALFGFGAYCFLSMFAGMHSVAFHIANFGIEWRALIAGFLALFTSARIRK